MASGICIIASGDCFSLQGKVSQTKGPCRIQLWQSGSTRCKSSQNQTSKLDLSLARFANNMEKGATDELSVAFTTGLKREKMLDLRGYDYISTSKPTNVKDELLKMLTTEVKSVLRLMSKPDTKTTPGTEPHKKTTSGLAGVKGSKLSLYKSGSGTMAD